MAEISPLLDSRRRTRHPIPIFRILLVLGTVIACCYLIPDDGSRELHVITQEGEETVSREITTAENILWKRCEQDDTMFCTTFTVPTDYQDLTAGLTHLAMTKIPATKPKLGSVLTNYGGPGASGYESSFTFGKNIHKSIGGSFDVISWDPRGIGRTQPVVDCWGSGLDAALVKSNMIEELGLEIPPGPIGNKTSAPSLTPDPILTFQLQREQSQLNLQASRCASHPSSEVLKYMGTTTLIRDTERINTVLEGPEAMINGIGGSYGTIWVAYLVNMFPEKVGKVVAHGVADPVMWSAEHYESYNLLSDLLLDAEKSLQAFYRSCFQAGPEHCPLILQGDKSWQVLQERVEGFLEKVYYEPIPAWEADRPGLITSGYIRQSLFTALQVPHLWTPFASALSEAIYDSNPSSLRDFLLPPTSALLSDRPGRTGQSDLSRLAVDCADQPPFKKGEKGPSAEELARRLERIRREVSPTFGATVAMMEQHGGCQYWPQSEKPVERFEGPWNHTLANPILVLSNVYDPITPSAAGKKMSALFGNMSRHVISESYGHSYLAWPQTCWSKVLTSYFEDGVLPKDGQFCPAEKGSNIFLHYKR